MDRENQLRERRRHEDQAVAAERAFADHASRTGIRTAFLAVLAADSVICGNGPEPGRIAYGAMSVDHSGQLLWEPAVTAAAPDGTLAFTSGPYQRLDTDGTQKGKGTYFSVWRRPPGLRRLELVLDFGAKDVRFPGGSYGVRRLLDSRPRGTSIPLGATLQTCLDTGIIPSLEGALLVGDLQPEGQLAPRGCFHSVDQELGVLWGAWDPPDGRRGAFALLMTDSQPEAVAAMFTA